MLPLAVLTAMGAASGGRGDIARGDCRPVLMRGYASGIERALRSGTDAWGNALLRARGGPTYARARRYLRPLFVARGPGGKPLTTSGAHYVAFSQPLGADGSGSAALHVADGSQILSKSVRGLSLTIAVGQAGGERFGSCLARSRLPRLADGYLPILETEYVDRLGVRYRQESFAGRPPDGASLVSWVRVVADARSARDDAEIVLRSAAGGVSANADVPAGAVSSVFFTWGHASDTLQATDRWTYKAARRAVAGYWRGRLAEGATIDVPEPRVRDATANLLVQNLALGWRYSVGNPYQQFSYPEGLDVARVMGEYGFLDTSAAILRRSLSTPRGPYPSWRLGQRLVAAAAHYRMFRDGGLVAELTPDLRQGVTSLGRWFSGDRQLLRRERFSSDIPDLVYGLHSQAVVWQGLRDMSRVWSQTGERGLAAESRRLADRLGSGLGVAVRHSQRRLRDGSVFVPVRLLEGERAHGSVPAPRAGR